MQQEAAREGGLLGVRALREWITGEHEQFSRVFFIASRAAVGSVHEVAGSDDVMLLPAESPPLETAADVVRYSGALIEPGDELFLEERGIELQDYIASAFVQIVGPTAVRFFDPSSWHAFLDDAELARRSGIFASSLIDPRIVLADRAALMEPNEFATPRALHIGADGSVRIGLQGAVIGAIDDLHEILARPVPRSAALESVAASERLAADLTARGSIGRYLRAADLMKMLRLDNGTARIAGFGWSPADDGLADAGPGPADPFLLATDEGFVLADTTTLRRQLLSPLTAGVVAATQTSSALELASDRVARRFAVTVDHARSLCLEAITVLGAHLGARIDRSTAEAPR